MNADALAANPRAMSLAMALVRWSPERLSRGLADAIADRVARQSQASIVRAVRANQAIARNWPLDYPDLDRAVRTVFRKAGQGYVTLFRALAKGREAMMAECELSEELVSGIEKGLALGHGVVLVGPHIGAFDLFLLTLAARGYSAQAISPAKPTGVYRLQNDLRRRFGVEVTPASKEALRLAIERLQRGGLVLTGMDRPVARDEGLTLFGRPTHLATGYARLAVRAGAALITGAVIPIAGGRYRTVAGELILPPETRTEATAREVAQRMLKEIEPLIRQYADEWLMFFPVWPDVQV